MAIYIGKNLLNYLTSIKFCIYLKFKPTFTHEVALVDVYKFVH